MVMKEMTNGKKCAIEDASGLYICSCTGVEDSSYPPLKILVGSRDQQHWFFLKNRDYLTYSQNKKVCAILIKPENIKSVNMWIMGDPFLRAYYSIYDLDERKIGLVGVAETVRKEELKELSKNSQDQVFDSFLDRIRATPTSIVLQVVIGLANVVAFCLLLCACAYCHRRMKKRELALMERELRQQEIAAVQQQQFEIEHELQSRRAPRDQEERIAQLASNVRLGAYAASPLSQYPRRPSNVVAQSPHVFYPDPDPAAGLGDAVMGVPVYYEDDNQMIRLEEIEQEQLHEAIEKSRMEEARRIAQ